MKFSDDNNCVIKKAGTMNSGLRLIRNKLKYDQFLKVMTSQYYGRCFYGCLAWLNGTNSFIDLRRINALHYRALRIEKNDHRRMYSRAELDLIGRARPTTWARYLLSSTTIKAVTRGLPTTLVETCLLRKEDLESQFFLITQEGRLDDMH